MYMCIYVVASNKYLSIILYLTFLKKIILLICSSFQLINLKLNHQTTCLSLSLS